MWRGWATPAPRERPADDVTILDEVPTIRPASLNDVPEPLLRDLYDSFNLELRHQPASHAVVTREPVQTYGGWRNAKSLVD